MPSEQYNAETIWILRSYSFGQFKWPGFRVHSNDPDSGSIQMTRIPGQFKWPWFRVNSNDPDSGSIKMTGSFKNNSSCHQNRAFMITIIIVASYIDGVTYIYIQTALCWQTLCTSFRQAKRRVVMVRLHTRSSWLPEHKRFCPAVCARIMVWFSSDVRGHISSIARILVTQWRLRRFNIQYFPARQYAHVIESKEEEDKGTPFELWDLLFYIVHSTM